MEAACTWSFRYPNSAYCSSSRQECQHNASYAVYLGAASSLTHTTTLGFVPPVLSYFPRVPCCPSSLMYTGLTPDPITLAQAP